MNNRKMDRRWIKLNDQIELVASKDELGIDKREYTVLSTFLDSLVVKV